MNIVPPPAPSAAEAASLGRIQSHVDTGLRHIGAAIAEFNRGHEEFWGGTDADVEARANLMGPAAVQLMFDRNLALGTLLNEALAERNAALVAVGLPPITAQVMRVLPGRDLAWNGTAFEVIPPPEPSPIEE